jgi:hypothetical protein
MNIRLLVLCLTVAVLSACPHTKQQSETPATGGAAQNGTPESQPSQPAPSNGAESQPSK